MEARVVKVAHGCWAIETRFTQYSKWITLNKEFPSSQKAKEYAYGRFGVWPK
jgi:hypothetical protein